MTDIAKSIKAINPNAEFSVNAEDYNQITWLNGTTPIAIDNIKAKQAELQKEYDLILRYYPETPFLDDLNKKMDNVNSELKKITTTSITP